MEWGEEGYKEAETLKTREFSGESKQALWGDAMQWLDVKYSKWRRSLNGQEMELSPGIAYVKAVYRHRNPTLRNMVYIYF